MPFASHVQLSGQSVIKLYIDGIAEGVRDDCDGEGGDGNNNGLHDGDVPAPLLARSTRGRLEVALLFFLRFALLPFVLDEHI